MIKPFDHLGDNWAEALINSLLLLILLPVLAGTFVIFLPIMGVDALARWIRKEPTPEIPKVIGKSELDSDEKARAYVESAKKLITNLSVKLDKTSQSYTLTTAMLRPKTVSLDYGHGILAISIDELNCYAWNTSESDDLDPFFWASICALRNGVIDVRTKFSRKMHWIWSEDQNVWIKVRQSGSSFDSMDFYKEPPQSVVEQFQSIHRPTQIKKKPM